jgi:hypothetical protein
MNEKSIGFADRKMLAITSQARKVVDEGRMKIFHETGILKSRYELASEYIVGYSRVLRANALAPKQEGAE